MIVTGCRQALAKRRLWARIVWLAFRQAGGRPHEAARTLRAFVAERARDRAQRPTRKYAFSRGRYFWDLYSPGFPSPAFDRFVLDALERVRPGRGRERALQTVILAITPECPLRCEHCCEAEVAANGQAMSPAEVRATLAALQERGVAQVFLSGGEPLARFAQLLELVEGARAGTDFWVFTSGWGLDRPRADRLREAGVTGVAVSLDHWDPPRHDAFRHRIGAFEMARSAAAAVRDAGLALCLSLCASRDFVSPENLEAYAALAAAWGADFVQLLEPKAVGRWQGQAVALDEAQRRLLEAFYLRANFEPAGDGLPAVAYVDYLQRRAGCLGAGQRYLYVDSAGGVHPCPFCRGAVGRLPDEPLAALVERLGRRGCLATANL